MSSEQRVQLVIEFLEQHPDVSPEEIQVCGAMSRLSDKRLKKVLDFGVAMQKDRKKNGKKG